MTELSFITYYRDIVGKTIKNIGYADYGGFLILFTDGSIVHIDAGADYDGSCDIYINAHKDDLSIYEQYYLDLITRGEFDSLVEQDRKRDRKQQYLHARQQYEWLKEEFEDEE